MKNLISKIISCIFCCAIITAIFSCEKLVEVDAPPTSVNSDVVFSDNASAAAVMTGIYAKMTLSSLHIASLSIYPELLADNLTLFASNSQPYLTYYRNALTPFVLSGGPRYWNQFYEVIYNANSVIEQVRESQRFSSLFKSQLLGEAYFMRAFSYYYLISLYGDVPLVVSTNYKETAKLGRTAVADINKQVVADLLKARELLRESYYDATLLKTTTDRLRPNKYAAVSLLSRAYLHAGAYADAEIQSTLVINETAQYDTIPLKDVFLRGSKETIWALQSVRIGENTFDALFYTLPQAGPNNAANPVFLSDRIMNVFELNDKRKDVWTGSVIVSGSAYYYPAKYKEVARNAAISEHTIVLRLAEQYLIRAEARAQQNKITEGLKDINIIRQRAGLPDANATSKSELLQLILKERRVELFTEWGHRWFDLKYSGKIDEIMPAVAIEKEATWKPEWKLFPVPNEEIVSNSNLTQNPGYSK